MSKQGKVLTIAEILKRKDELKNRKKKTSRLYVDSLEREIVIKAPDRQVAFESVSKAQSGDPNADSYVVYECVVDPDLKSKELQEGLNVFSPIDVVDELFTAGEIAAISSFAMQLAGFGQGVHKVGDDIKN